MEETARFFLDNGFFGVLIKDLAEIDSDILTKFYIDKHPEEQICKFVFDKYNDLLTPRQLRGRRNRAIKKMHDRYRHYLE